MNLDAALALLAQNSNAPLDLAEVALLLARDEYPDLDVEAYLAEIDAMVREARHYVRGDTSAQVAGLCRYLFHEMGFHGNRDDYYNPLNSYLNQVLDRRTGIPISLSALAMSVGRRLGLTTDGVGLPGHFIVKVASETGEILFDPFHGGRRLAPADCEILVKQATGLDFAVAAAEQLPAIPLSLLLVRMLTNLKAVYFDREDYPRAIRTIERIRQIQPEEASHRRDLGACWLRSGQPGRSIDHLEAYLSAVPLASDAAGVEKLLQQARGQIAQWN